MTLPPPWFIALGVLRPENLSFGPVAARYVYSLQSVSRAGAVFQLSASLFAESITLAVCFAEDDANEEVVNRFLDFYEAELPSLPPFGGRWTGKGGFRTPISRAVVLRGAPQPSTARIRSDFHACSEWG
jgi:hypothetical protein